MLNSQLQKIKNNFNSYDKPHLSFEKQLQRLKDNGLNIHNDAYAVKKLSHVNYYRLSAYFLPFQFPKDSDNADEFFEGTQFREIIKLYDFDAKLRRLVFGALEVIEVYIRTQVTYHHTKKYKAFGYLQFENFDCSQEYFDKLIRDIKEESKRSDEKFVSHFKKKYGSNDLPLWTVVEVLSFGTVSRLFSAMKVEDQKLVSQSISVHHKVLQNWLHAFTIVRNICAHHSRLWNKQLRIPFTVPAKKPLFTPMKKITKMRFKEGNTLEISYENNASLFFALSVIKYIFDSIGEEVDFLNEVKQLMAQHHEMDFTAMGFVDGWENTDIWSEV